MGVIRGDLANRGLADPTLRPGAIHGKHLLTRKNRSQLVTRSVWKGTGTALPMLRATTYCFTPVASHPDYAETRYHHGKVIRYSTQFPEDLGGRRCVGRCPLLSLDSEGVCQRVGQRSAADRLHWRGQHGHGRRPRPRQLRRYRGRLRRRFAACRSGEER